MRNALRHSISTVLTVLAVFMFISLEAEAESCEITCGQPCTGQCSISSPSCGASCYGAQCPGTVTCKEFGGTVLECTYSVTTDCKEGSGGGPGDPENPQWDPGESLSGRTSSSRWAVVEYYERDLGHGTRLLHPEMHVLSASDSDLGAKARSHVRREGKLATREELPTWDSIEARRRLQFHVAPVGSCTRFEIGFARELEFEPPPVRRAVFFRLLTKDGGRIVDAEPLFSEAPERNASLSAFLQTNGQLRSDGNGPLQAYVVLVLEPNGKLGYLLGGGQVLARQPAQPR